MMTRTSITVLPLRGQIRTLLSARACSHEFWARPPRLPHVN
jgi:hypothetical protein